MTEVVFDIETDGLEPTEIFIVCAKVIDRGLIHEFYDSFSWNTWIKEIKPTKLIGHNIINFDLPVLEKLWDFKWEGDVWDTLVLSRLACPDRKGGHSLNNWGVLLNYEKGEHDDFKSLTHGMVEYCIRDVILSERTAKRVERELNGFSEQSIQLEQDIARIVGEQERNGWKINERKAMLLLNELEERKEELERRFETSFPPIHRKEYVEVKYKKDGTLFNIHARLPKDDKGYYREYIDYFNPSSRQQIVTRLKMLGWKPTILTEKGNVKIDESILKTIDIPEASLLVDFFLLTKRIVMVKAWLGASEKDGRVHGKVNSCGAISGRMTHFSPNMAQIPASYSVWGKECRELWETDKDSTLVGMDASGLELRMLAHYMNNQEFTNEILNGDIHTYNQRLAELDTRDQAKTFIYAFIYGAGDKKLGEIIGGSKKDGSKLRTRFLRSLPELKNLRGRVIGATRKGYLKGLDRRKLHIRSPHSALNLLLQGAGAIVMKQALIILSKHDIITKGLGKFVGNIHDEIQMEVKKEYAEELGIAAVEAIREAGKVLNLNLPMDGEYKIGSNWALTH